MLDLLGASRLPRKRLTIGLAIRKVARSSLIVLGISSSEGCLGWSGVFCVGQPCFVNSIRKAGRHP